MAGAADFLDPVTRLANRTLLDALEALGPEHRAAFVLVGAQAIYHHVGDDGLLVSQFTTDADLTVDPALVAGDPLVQDAMHEAGFDRTPPRGSTKSVQPGQWYKSTSAGVLQVDLIVPRAEADRLAISGRRSAHVTPHHKDAFTTARGLEASLVDNSPADIVGLEPGDDRTFSLRIAGPAALVIAKAHKLGERVAQGRGIEKDAYDVFRLLRGSDLTIVRDRIQQLSADERCSESVAGGVAHLRRWYADEFAPGPVLTARAEPPGSDAVITRELALGLVRAILP